MSSVAFNHFHASNLTANSGTAITCLIPPRVGAYTLLTDVLYRCGSTAHTITLLKALGKSTLSAAVAASGTSITLATNPGTYPYTSPSGVIANSDWVCIQLDPGSDGLPRYFLSAISSLSSLTMTVDALPFAAAAGNSVWHFGVPSDHTSSQTTAKTNAGTGSQILATVSILNSWSPNGGLCHSLNQGDPIMVHSDNASNAGKFEVIAAEHTKN